MKNFLLTFFILLFINGFSQALEFEVNFDESCRTEVGSPISETFKVNKSEKIPFVGISAYVMQPGIETELFYRVKSGEEWLEWQRFNPMTEGHTEDRTTFEGPPIYGKADVIQFRSSKVVDQTFVFRLYFPPVEKKKPQQRVK